MSHREYDNSDASKRGQAVGNSVLSTTENLRKKFQQPVVAHEGGFPVQVAPWNKAEANEREKLQLTKGFTEANLGKDVLRVNYNVDHKELAGILDQKRASMAKHGFYEFLEGFMRQYHYSPEIVKYVRDLVPEYFAEQEAQVEKWMEIEKQAAMLAIKKVPTNIEEMLFLYALANGEVELKTGPLWDKNRDADPNKRAENYKRGLFSKNYRASSGRSANKDFIEQFAGSAANPYTDLANNKWSGMDGLGFPSGKPFSDVTSASIPGSNALSWIR
jgi:hypothetical protein